jgi:hypothetical protein
MKEESVLPADPDLFPGGEEPGGKTGAAAQRETGTPGLLAGYFAKISNGKLRGDPYRESHSCAPWIFLRREPETRSRGGAGARGRKPGAHRQGRTPPVRGTARAVGIQVNA